MESQSLNSQLQISIESIFKTIFTTHRITRSELQTLILFIRSSKELQVNDLHNINQVIESLQQGKLQVLN